MRTIFCIVHALDREPKAAKQAISDVQSGGGRVLFVAISDPDDERVLYHRLAAKDFVGHRMTEEITKIADQTAHEELRDKLEENLSLAKEANIQAETLLTDGSTVEVLQNLAAEWNPAKVYVNKLPEKLWDRIARTGLCNIMSKVLPCPVVVVS